MKVSKSIGARTQPCLTLLRVSNGSEKLSLNCTVPFVSVWKDSIMLCSLGGQPIFGRTLKRPSLLTRSNDLSSEINESDIQGHMMFSEFIL